MEDLMQKIISLAKRRGFIFPGSEIYGGLANSFDYGPLGVELKNNIKQEWWKRFVQQRSDIVGIDAALIMNPKVWEASGHLSNFSDPLVECKKCHSRFRVDQLIQNDQLNIQHQLADLIKKYFDENLSDDENKVSPVESIINGFEVYLEQADYTGREIEIILKYLKRAADEAFSSIDYDIDVNREGYIEGGWNFQQSFYERFLESRIKELAEQIFLDRHIKCPNCKKREWGEVNQFNLMLKTFLGPVEDTASTKYFRPETAQAMFVDFKNILGTSRQNIPFGIAQIGKVFRNEITPGNFIFRTREFEQMEIEYFVKEAEWEKHFKLWLDEMKRWLKDLGISAKKLHYVDIPNGERAHYSKRTVDIEYDYPFGQKELYGLTYRGDFDLKNHFPKDAPYRDPDTGEAFWPHVIEPTWGVDRTLLVVMLEAYHEEKAPTTAAKKGEPRLEGQEDGESAIRIVMKFPAWLAPIKVAVLPLVKNKPKVVKKAKEVFDMLVPHFSCQYDETGSIGKRYRRQDEVGTPYCITIDFDSLENNDVTIRDRDTMKQERVSLDSLVITIKKQLDDKDN